jgi:hypothetical protein
MLFVRISVLACICLCFGQGAPPGNIPAAGPQAVVTNASADYCFTRVRGNDPSQMPPAYLVLQLRVRVAYHNGGTSPMILPLERERALYTALKPGPMEKFPPPPGLYEPGRSVMKKLPADVSPESPIQPKNDVFTVIPAGGEMTPALMEDFTLVLNHKTDFRTYPDLRGHRVYVQLQFAHRQLAPALEAALSDRWSRFGVLWTGTLRTNVFTIDVPAAPHAAACKDDYTGTPTLPNDRK